MVFPKKTRLLHSHQTLPHVCWKTDFPLNNLKEFFLFCYYFLFSGTLNKNLMSTCCSSRSFSSCCVSLATWSSWFSTSGWHSVRESPTGLPASSSTSSTCSSCRERTSLLCTRDRCLFAPQMFLWHFVEASPCWCDSTDRAADIPAFGSYALRTCTAVRKAALLVLALPGRQRSAETQSRLKKNVPLPFHFNTQKLTLSFWPLLRVTRGWGAQARTTPSLHPMTMMKRRDLTKWATESLSPNRFSFHTHTKVPFFFLLISNVLFELCCSLILQTCVCTRPSTPSNSAWAAFPTPPPTCGSGLSA